MGVLREEDKPKPLRIEDVVPATITYADYVFDDTDSSDDEIVVLSLQRRNNDEDCPSVNPAHKLAYERRSNRRIEKYNSKKAVHQVDKKILSGNVENIKKHMGAHKWRRIENARLLAEFADANDIRFDCSDLIEDTMSAFARLMQNEETMRMWNEFVEKDEEEQEKFLHQLDKELQTDCHFPMNDMEDKRSCHPGYSAKTCFMKMDNEFKKALSKKSGVRLELIEKLENEFREFFSEKPGGVWTKTESSNQKRFYLHAVAQFLMLQSRSQQNTKRETITEVHNPRKKFEPPKESLHSFLNKKHSRGGSKGLVN